MALYSNTISTVSGRSVMKGQSTDFLPSIFFTDSRLLASLERLIMESWFCTFWRTWEKIWCLIHINASATLFAMLFGSFVNAVRQGCSIWEGCSYLWCSNGISYLNGFARWFPHNVFLSRRNIASIRLCKQRFVLGNKDMKAAAECPGLW